MSFQQLAEEYGGFLKSIGIEDIDILRIETQIESWKDWSIYGTIDTVAKWYLEQQVNCTMQISNIPLESCRDWYLDAADGYIKHKTGDFFYVQGVRIGQSGSREVGSAGWDQPILTQVGFNGGLLGLLRKKFDGIPHYLIEAKAEPGNPDKVQISPTLQATFSNLKKAHGGKKPRFAEYFETPEQMGSKVLFDQWMSEDGGRLHLKKNRGMLVEVTEDTEFDIPLSFQWLSLYQLKYFIKKNSWVNPHVRGIISHL
ncbi:MAG: NDP-hexose 2,3-dehydratase family protein [Syntrophomonadaceae bacterium]|nr:NDP-hexose 2,3-dehydratase family protein [Syntrophomonadaceae bacterium]